MKADEKTAKEIITILESYSQAYAHKDLKGLMKLVAPDNDLIFIGTGEDEWVKGPLELEKGFKRDLTQTDSITVGFEDIRVSAADNVAWTATWMTMKAIIDSAEVVLKGRFSAVFEKRDNNWLIVHLHFSLPASEQETGESFPV